MTYGFELSDELPATPQTVYDAWMLSGSHTAMTGGHAEVDARVGGEFEAWDGYITGRTVALEPGRRITQSWRTSDFAEADEDSQIEVVLEPHESGTTITIRHTNVPDSLRSFEEGGWQAHYFEPMRAYFATG